MTAPEFVNTEIPRDRYGRPMITQPGSTKRVPYRRTTTFVGALEDTYNLQKWKMRRVAYGMGQRKDLVLAAAASDPEDKHKLNEIVENALEAAESSAAATTGTALHSLTERIDRGQPLGVIPNEYENDIAAYQAATQNIEWCGIESFRVYDRWQVAGTADRIGKDQHGRIRIYDIKTGSIDYPHKMAMQLAMYARSLPYDIPTDKRGNPEDALDLNRGVIIHLPAGQGRCDLYEIDIASGWGACLIAHQVWKWRGVKDLTKLFDPDAEQKQSEIERAFAELACARRAANAETLEELREVWNYAKEYGVLTEDFRAFCTERSRELAAATNK
jgi:hypothetical protein